MVRARTTSRSMLRRFDFIWYLNRKGVEFIAVVVVIMIEMRIFTFLPEPDHFRGDVFQLLPWHASRFHWLNNIEIDNIFLSRLFLFALFFSLVDLFFVSENMRKYRKMQCVIALVHHNAVYSLNACSHSEYSSNASVDRWSFSNSPNVKWDTLLPLPNCWRRLVVLLLLLMMLMPIGNAFAIVMLLIF